MRTYVISLLFAASAAYAADKLVGGPYVVFPASRSATIGWVVETGSVGTGSTPDALSRTTPVLRSEKSTLTGLKAGETVYYEIPAGVGSPEARKGHFKVPPTGAANFQFVVFGDTRTRHDLHRKVIQAISKIEPDFVLHTGDLVTDGYDTAQWPLFFDIEGELLRKTVFFPVLGNHERNNARFHEFFDVDTPYYSFNWGTSHFIILNSDTANLAISAPVRERFWQEQTKWLEDDLIKSQKSDFRFVIMHHPPFTVNQRADHMSKETPGLVPLFEKYKVAAVFAGHDHNYQRHVKNGIQYIVTGGGGAPLAPVEGMALDITKKIESVEHYVPIKVNGKRVSIEAVALDGRVIDKVELNP